MSKILSTLAMLVYLVTGVIMGYYYITYIYSGFGLLGVLIGIIVSPILAFFPFIYWFLEGIFPWNYIIIQYGGVLLASLFIIISGMLDN